MNIEVLEFIRPDDGKNSLYITNISQNLDTKELYDILYERFSPFGLLHEICVLESTPQPAAESDHVSVLRNTSHTCHSNLYAFVKFYSRTAAARAKKELTGRLFVAGKCMRVQFSTRKPPSKPVLLYCNKCYELANYYLGFNGWSISIIMCKENKEHSVIKPDEIQFVYGVKLHIPHHGVSTEGYGVGTASYDRKDPATKSVALCRAKKQAHQQAVQNAFHRVLLLVLDNGKVYVDINSTVEDRVYCDEQLTLDNLLEVNELSYNPTSEADAEFNDSIDIDLINQQLLEELETSCS